MKYYLSSEKFFILCDVIFLVRLKEKFEINSVLGMKGLKGWESVLFKLGSKRVR